MPQRRGTEVDSFRLLPVGCIVGSSRGAYEPRRIRDPAPQSTGSPPAEGLAPSRQPFRATGLLNGMLGRTSLVCRSSRIREAVPAVERAKPSFT